MSGDAAARAVASVAARAGGGWRRGAGIALGVVAAAGVAGVAIERLTVSRGVRREARLALDAAGPYGTLRGTPGTALAEDGTALYYEVDEPEPAAAAAGVTVVFSHGFCLNQDSWHFQRAALRGAVRTVHWDLRGHGRSGRGAPGEPVTIDRLGRDLRAVIDAAAPEGPLVLVGHSTGGMTVMALAEQYPELVRDRVVGVALVGTSAGRLAEVDYGLPAAGAYAVHRVLPGALRVLGGRAELTELVERGRRATADLFTGVVKRYSFAGREVDPAVARFAERMIEATPFEVVAEFHPAFAAHDKTAALARFAGLPVLVLAGEQDLITPPEHSEAVAEALPDAALVLLPEAGHLVMLEHPDAVTDRLLELLARAGAVPTATTVDGYGTKRAASGTAGDDG
ncbi:alpha/beta hydrolase [Streptomyces sp. NPDC002454]